MISGTSELLCSKMQMLLILLLCSSGSGSYIGINIGTQMSNLPPAADIVSILKAHQIKHVRLFNADHRMLRALANTGIEVLVGVPNEQLLQIGNSESQAADWINRNVAPFVPATSITYIAVGDEISTTFPNASRILVPAMQFLHSALLAANLNFQVKVSSPQSMDMIPKHFPPSTATFNSSWSSVMEQLLRFLKDTGGSFMLNVQPYFGYTEGEGIFPLEYALFQPLKQGSQMVDPDTDLHYLNMFDAMVDSAYYSMQYLNFSGISVMVTSSGWPSLGGATEPDANIDNALAYNSFLIRRAINGSGTPSRPNSSVSIYLHELFSEDLRAGPVSAKNWGVFASNGTALYPLNFGHLGEHSSNSTGLEGIFCVANSRADSGDLKKGLDWACGPGSANCTVSLVTQPWSPLLIPVSFPARPWLMYLCWKPRRKLKLQLQCIRWFDDKFGLWTCRCLESGFKTAGCLHHSYSSNFAAIPSCLHVNHICYHYCFCFLFLIFWSLIQLVISSNANNFIRMSASQLYLAILLFSL